MRTAAPREGLDHAILLPGSAAFASLLFGAALTGALPTLPAIAQAAPPCTAIEDDAERLACYDRALRAAPPPPAAQGSSTPPAQAPRAAPAAAPDAAAPAPAVAPSRERAVRESAAPVAPAAPTAGRAANDDGIVPIVIVGMRGLPGRETIFTAADGATWVQTDTQRVAGLPDPPFEAELKPGSLGSYFLVPKEHGRAIRVRAASR